MSQKHHHHTTALPGEINPNVPHEARVYDYWLGGKDNYEADRALGDEIARLIPSIRLMARANRAFLARAVRYLVTEAGVTQFLDIGTGIPSAGNTHEVAQQLDPKARIAYVDNDPIVLAHARALMAGTAQGRTAYVHADLHDPHSILNHPAVTATLDFTRPVAVMLVAVMMYFRDEQGPHDIIRALLDAVPRGSHLALTHPTADFNPTAMAAVTMASEQSGIPFQPRSRSEVGALLHDCALVEPGIAPVLAWRPDPATPPDDPDAAWYWAAVGRKP